MGTIFATKGGLLSEISLISATTHLEVGTTKRSALFVDDCVSVNELDSDILKNVDSRFSIQFSGETLFELLLTQEISKS